MARHSMPTDLQTVTLDIDKGVATITLNRPEVYNSFNEQMAKEMRALWQGLASNDDVRCVILTAAGDKAFCTGIDRNEAMGDGTADAVDTSNDNKFAGFDDAWNLDDPGDWLGPKSNNFWKPVIAAVNGMACGGAFYFLGEVEFIIAADHATFFDPHVTFGMIAAFEPVHMINRMPFGEIMRVSLMGSSERMSAQRAHQVGLVSEICPSDELMDRARWAAEQIAAAPMLPTMGTVKVLWTAQELSRKQALELMPLYVNIGNDPEALAEGQKRFASGERIVPRTR